MTTQGDEVDDLLAGKPVVITPEEQAPAVVPRPATQAETDEVQFTQPLEAPPVVEESPWDVVIGPQPAARTSRASEMRPDASTPRQPPPSVQLVPEPPAIALAVGALLYFLIFFRRWQLT